LNSEKTRFKLAGTVSIIFVLFLLSGFFYIGTPFKTSEAFKTLSGDTRLIIGITHVVLGDNEDKNTAFWENADAVIASLPNQHGYLGHKIRKKLFSNDAWTMTIWESSTSLNSFVNGEVHSTAIGYGLPAVKEARFVRFTALKSDIPLSWKTVEEEMQKNGRKLY
jgi:heme-degrading monooxygenase HmoA